MKYLIQLAVLQKETLKDRITNYAVEEAKKYVSDKVGSLYNKHKDKLKKAQDKYNDLVEKANPDSIPDLAAER